MDSLSNKLKFRNFRNSYFPYNVVQIKKNFHEYHQWCPNCDLAQKNHFLSKIVSNSPMAFVARACTFVRHTRVHTLGWKFWHLLEPTLTLHKINWNVSWIANEKTLRNEVHSEKMFLDWANQSEDNQMFQSILYQKINNSIC